MIVRAASRAVAALLAVAILVSGFPAGDRITAVALAAAVAAFALGFSAPGRGLAVVALACAMTGAATAASGAHGVLPWPALIALWFGTGAVTRQIVRGAAPLATPLDRSVAELGVFWTLAAGVAALSARTFWAAAHRLSVRAVNVIGTTDADAIHRTVMSLAAVFAGVAMYDVARGVSPARRGRAVRAFVVGAAISGAAAWLQSRGVIAAHRSGFWKMLGRFAGLQSDPNAAGVLAALAIGPALGAVRHGRAKALWGALTVALAAGVAVSGSRSGILAAILSIGALLFLERRRGARWALPVLALLAAASTVILFAASRGPGGAAERLLSILRSDASFDFRTSSRRIFWSSAWEAFRHAPLGGIGWDAFSWRLPNLSASLGSPIAMIDNPGNFYLQLLCETGIAGAAIFGVFAVRAWRAVAGSIGRDAASRAGAAALIGFAPALAVGSHLFAAEVSIAAFLLLALVAPEHELSRPRSPIRALSIVAAAVVGWILLLAPSRFASEAFRYGPSIGFYAPETGKEGIFRWMRPRSAVRLAAGERQNLILRFPGLGGAADRISIHSEGRLLYARTLGRPPVSIALVAPARRGAIFFFESSFRFRPADQGIPDPRLLSIHVSRSP